MLVCYDEAKNMKGQNSFLFCVHISSMCTYNSRPLWFVQAIYFDCISLCLLHIFMFMFMRDSMEESCHAMFVYNLFSNDYNHRKYNFHSFTG